MNDSDLYDVKHAATSDEVVAFGTRRTLAQIEKSLLLREVLTLIYRTALDVDSAKHPTWAQERISTARARVGATMGTDQGAALTASPALTAQPVEEVTHAVMDDTQTPRARVGHA